MTLILLRHGESEWNRKTGSPAGWTSIYGRAMPRLSGRRTARGGRLLIDVRPHLVLAGHPTAGSRWTPPTGLAAAERNWRLNERHYGGLPASQRHAGRVRRRAVHGLAPLLRRAAAAARGETISTTNDRRYGHAAEARPDREPEGQRGACCPTGTRDLPAPERRQETGRRPRQLAPAIVKRLDRSARGGRRSQHPDGIPLAYELDDDLKPVTAGGRLFDPEAAAASIEAVKNQGKEISPAGAFVCVRAPTGRQRTVLPADCVLSPSSAHTVRTA